MNLIIGRWVSLALEAVNGMGTNSGSFYKKVKFEKYFMRKCFAKKIHAI